MDIDYQFGHSMSGKEMEDIRANIDHLLSTPKGSVPLARDLGVSWRNLSEITPDLENEYAVEIVSLIERYEPRVSVEQVAFEYDAEGRVLVKIVLEGGDEDG